MGTTLGLTGIVVVALFTPTSEATSDVFAYRDLLPLLPYLPFLGLFWWGVYEFVKAKGLSGNWFWVVVLLGCAGPILLVLLDDHAPMGEVESS